MKYLASILPILVGVAALLTPFIAPFVAAHPTFATVLAAVVAVVNHWLPAPTASVAK
jgi:hypothetical protein